MLSKLSFGRNRRVLIAYFSWYPNIEPSSLSSAPIDAITGASLINKPGLVTQAAQWIEQVTSAPLISIESSKVYPTDYEACLEQAIEEKTRHYRPQVRPTSWPTAEFDFLFLGFPNWSYTLPMPVCTWLEKQNFAGKKIAPFCVHGTGGFARTLNELRRCAKGAILLNPLSLEREDVLASRKQVQKWASESLMA